jgi:hypothetical protein
MIRIIYYHLKKEKPPRVGGYCFNNHSDSAAHMTPIINNLRGLVRGSDWSGRSEHQKGMKPSKFLKSPYDDEDEGLVVRSAKCFTPN